MSKFWAIFKREYSQVVKKKSFLIGLLLTPAIMIAFILIPSYLARTKSTSSEPLAVVDQSGSGAGASFLDAIAEYKLEGKDEPYYAVKGQFVVAPDDSARFQALYDSLREEVNTKSIKYFLVVKPGVELIDTNIYVVTNSDNFVTLNRFERKISRILSERRLALSNINLSVDSVLHLSRQIDLNLRDTKGASIPFEIKYFAALIMVMLIFSMIITYGSLLMRSVIDEKNSRIMEVLVSSVSPFQLMLGKVFGLGAATFTSVLAWVAMGVIIYLGSGAIALEIDPSIARLIYNPVVVVFFVLFLTAGYLLYSTLFALIGSIVNTEKEAQNFIFPITLSLLAPVMVGISVVQEPNSTLALVMSFIPFFTPTMMMLRIVFIAPTVTHFSFFSGILGEAILSFLLLSLTVVGIIWLTGRIFRVGILMYGKRPTLGEIAKWVRYR